MIKILFFAQIRELVGVSSLTYHAEHLSVCQLLKILSEQGDKWSLALSERTVLCAVNKTLVDLDYVIQVGDEIAFFPPVTGG